MRKATGEKERGRTEMMGEGRLKTVIFCLTEEWREAAQELVETLKQSQISVSFSTKAEVRRLADAMRRSGSRDDVEKALQTLVLTDSQEVARELRRVKSVGVNAEDDGKPEERLADTGNDRKPEGRLADTEGDGKPEGRLADTGLSLIHI